VAAYALKPSKKGKKMKKEGGIGFTRSPKLGIPLILNVTSLPLFTLQERERKGEGKYEGIDLPQET